MRGVFTWIIVVAMSGAVMLEALVSPGFSFAREVRMQTPAPASINRVAQAQGRTIAKEAMAVSSSGPDESAPPTQSQEPKPQAEPAGFAVDRYLVEGNSLLSEEVIDAILAKYKRGSLSIKDIEQAKNELEKAYHTAGYPTVLVTIPEQTIESGTVRLFVVEGRIGSIAVTGNTHFKRYEILEKLPSLKHGEVLYEPAFIKELDLLNVHPDRKVAPILKPGEETGLVNLELKVKDRLPVHGKLEGDNKGPITTPRNRLVAEVQHANVFGGDEITC
jgi:hemolysin activation/secretion protein